MKDRRVWLTKKGSLNSSRGLRMHLEGVVVSEKAHYKGERHWVRVQWDNGEFGTYYIDEGYLTEYKPKSLREKQEIA